jgi:murein L,D-transpeptidase YcbB/YkuD
MYVEPAQAHFSGEGDARMNERRRCGEKGMANQKPFVFNDEAIHEYDGEIDWKFQRDHQAILGSHGCVRVQKSDAIKLYSWVEEKKTKVWVI